MPRVQAQSCQFVRNISYDSIDLIGKFNISACMGVYHRADAVFCRLFADSFDVSDHGIPLYLGKPRRLVRMSCRVISFVVTPVHDGHIGSGIVLAFMYRKWRQLRNERADIIRLLQQIFIIILVNQIVEDRARNDRQSVLLKLRGYFLHIDRKISVRPQLDCPVSGFSGFLKNSLPRREIRILHIVYAPAAGRSADIHTHNFPS